MSTSPPELPIGRHRVRLCDDTIEITLCGDVTLEDYVALEKHYDAIVAAHGYVLMLVDTKQAGSVDAKARRMSANWSRRNAKRICAALYGGSLPMRAIITMLATAGRLLTGYISPFRFCDTAEEARSFLDRFRKDQTGRLATGS
jgi:hypothetical protein